MRAALPLLLVLGGCQLPDRWSMTGGSTVGGGLESAYHGERDFDSQYLELGVSGPLGSPSKASRLAELCEPPKAASAPITQPDASGGVPWTEILILLSGAAAWKGGEVGYKKVRSRRQSA